MRPIIQTLSDASGGAKSTAPLPPDIYLNPFSVSLQTEVTGAATYTVEWTQDDIWAAGYDPDAGTSVWNVVAGMDAAVVSATATFNEPVRAFRMRQTAGAGSVKLIIVQGGAAS